MQNSFLKKYGPYLLNTPMGMFIGVLVGIILSWILSGEFGHEWSRLYTFVVTALVSLGVAGFAVAGVIANIQTQFERDDEARRRKLMAEKSVFALHLADFSKMCQEMAQEAIQVGRVRVLQAGTGRVSADIRAPVLNEIARKNFAGIIEFHDDPNIASRLSYLLGYYQVFASRWETIRATAEGRSQIYSSHWEATVSWLYLASFAVSLMHYARNDDEPADITEEWLRSWLENLHLSDAELECCESYVGMYARKYLRDFGENG